MDACKISLSLLLLLYTFAVVPGGCSEAAGVQTSAAINLTNTGKKIITPAVAVNLALNHSNELSGKELSLDKAEELNDDLSIEAGTYDASLLKSKDSLQTSELWSAKQVSMTKEKIEYDTVTALNEIIQQEDEIIATELELKIKQEELSIAIEKTAAGLESENDKLTTESEYKQLKKEYEVAKLTLEENKRQFADDLGLEKDTYVLESSAKTFTPMGKVDIDYLVRSELYDDPYIWYYQKQLASAELSLKLFDVTTDSTPYKVRQINVDQAELDLSDLKITLEDSMRSGYSTIITLEENYSLLETKIAKAENDLEFAQAKYELGMISKQELDNTELVLKQLRVEKEQTINEHDSQIKLLQKPFLML